MQATASKKQFGFGRFGGSVAAVGIAAAFAAGIVTGIAGQAVLDDTNDSTGAAPAIVRPKAYFSAGQGEGLLAAGAGVSTLKAHDVEGMGEGRLTGNAPLAVLPMAYTMAGQGEGILGGNTSRDTLVAPVVAYDVAGMGEGWLAQGRPQSTLRAHPSDGQGEGWVSNGRP